jgi:hypothetical protein
MPNGFAPTILLVNLLPCFTEATAEVGFQQMPSTFVFQCNSDTYLECVERNVFGSNKPWALEVKEGDYCFLQHYELGSLLGLWKATSNGGKNLVPKIWGGKFPFQVKVTLALPKIADVPRKLLTELGLDPAIARFDTCLDQDVADALADALLGTGA